MRKKKQLEVCLDTEAPIESDELYLFPQMRFIHNALPELDSRLVDTGTGFLNFKIDLPLFISCMTGGSDRGFRANVNLAKAAESANIPVGMGSFRILLEKPDLFHHFELKKYAPSVPVMGNIGLVQIRDESVTGILKIAGDLGVDAMSVHINSAQELFQTGGDRNFLGLKETLAEFIELSPLPVIVKETGCGFTSSLISLFSRMGAAYIDTAGGGGTNWISVEGEINSYDETSREFRQWGIPTAVSLYLSGKSAPLLASGGIRTGMDAVKAIALGAHAAGMARPFIKAVHLGGEDGVLDLIYEFKKIFHTVMVLTGSKNVDALKRVPLIFDSNFMQRAEQYREAAHDSSL